MMKKERIYLIIFGLFLISLLSFPKEIAVYGSLILVGFCISALVFYKKPGFLNSKTIRHLQVALIILLLYSVLFFFIKADIAVFCIALAALLLYSIFRVKERRIHQQSDASQEEGRRALRTDLCFDVELSSSGDSNSSCRGITKDLSTSGMKVFTSRQLTKGDEFYFRLYLPEESWPLTGEAKVVWCKTVKDGFEHGLIFTKMSEQNRGKLALKQGFSLLE